jgi:hypothetical protein
MHYSGANVRRLKLPGASPRSDSSERGFRNRSIDVEDPLVCGRDLLRIQTTGETEGAIGMHFLNCRCSWLCRSRKNCWASNEPALETAQSANP